MSKKIGWGILGCGKIAKKMAADLRLVADADLRFVAARQRQHAVAFAREFNVPNAGDYFDLVRRPDVDVIYVATPHGLHDEHVRLCLENGKAVLCEKAFTINARQAQELIALAKTRGLFLMEAFWTRFLPHYEKAREVITTLGNIRYVQAEFGFKPTPPVADRIYNPALGGGSLLDIGVYPVFLALDVLGKPDEIAAVMSPATTGVDEQCAIRFQYANGALAQLFSSFSVNLATGADIAGTHGRLRLTHRFHGPTAQLEYYPGPVDTRQLIETERAKGNGYEYEARHVTKCLQQGLTESPVRPLRDTLLLMETLDAIRKQMGLIYSVDGLSK